VCSISSVRHRSTSGSIRSWEGRRATGSPMAATLWSPRLCNTPIISCARDLPATTRLRRARLWRPTASKAAQIPGSWRGQPATVRGPSRSPYAPENLAIAIDSSGSQRTLARGHREFP
jgi:hypothetical protein